MLNERIKTLRAEKGLSQEQVAEKLNLSRQAVAKWESGETVPELENLLALADLFQVTLDALLRGERPCTVCADATKTCMEDEDDLIAFLLRAGAATYAGKGYENRTPSLPGAHEYEYREGERCYRDRYFGSSRFAGEEQLFVGDRCAWAMNYCGRTLSERFQPDVLKAALLKRPANKPFRGPEVYRDGRYTYYSEVNGDFSWFSGSEAIYCDEERVYECVYHGGRVEER